MKNVIMSNHFRLRGASGFTLIELMITVSIVAILAVIALPSYQNYITRTNRGAAKACLSQYSQFMERYYTTNLTYVGATPSASCSSEGNLNQRYTFGLVSGSIAQSTYKVAATPINAQLSSDTRCGTLTLDQNGARSAGTGSTADIAYCW